MNKKIRHWIYIILSLSTIVLLLFSFLGLFFSDKTNFLTTFNSVVPFCICAVAVIMVGFFPFFLFSDKRICEKSALQENFIHTITHELKTPIATIALATEALKEQEIQQHTDLTHNYLRIINEENQRLRSMVETILETASDSKKSFLFRQKNNHVDIHDTIKTAVEELKLLLQQKKGTINIAYHAVDSICNVDDSQIITVFKNSIENAIKYTLDVPPKIEIETENKGKYLIISIKDNGMGIPKNQQKKIFERLYRSPLGNVHNIKGYGLGLYHVRAIIQAHHGKIKVKSELNKGSKFIICLPII